MELARPFIRLPFAFDAGILEREVRTLPANAWMAHPLGLPGNFAVPLISRGGGDNDEFHGSMSPTPHLMSCKYMQQVMAAFKEVLGRSRLMKLEPDCEVSEHIDFNYHWYTRVRIHVPVITSAEVRFYCADESVNMRPGESWIFNSWCRHRVVNGGSRERVHLVIDTAGSSRFWRMVRRMQAVDLSDTAAIDAVAVHVPYEPGKRLRLPTERFNVSPVMSPGEIDALVSELIRDFRANRRNDRWRVEEYDNLLSDFAKDWREIWHLFGPHPEGWPHYHAAIAAVHQRLRADGNALLTSSNEIAVNLIIVNRILKPALAPDQYASFAATERG